MHSIIVAWEFHFHVWKYEIYILKSDISMHDNDDSAAKIFLTQNFHGKLALPYFMHGISGPKLSFSCMDIIFMLGNFIFMHDMLLFSFHA